MSSIRVVSSQSNAVSSLANARSDVTVTCPNCRVNHVVSLPSTDTKDIHSDVAKTDGPGGWRYMHISAIKATTSELKKAYALFQRAFIEIFRCKNCRDHGMNWLNVNPFNEKSSYWYLRDSKGVDIGAWMHSYDFHNMVNARRGVSPISADVAILEYLPSPAGSFCTGNCGDDTKQSTTRSLSQTIVIDRNTGKTSVLITR